MITIEELLSIDKNNLEEPSRTIEKDDLPTLIEWLSEKDDTIRYRSLLLLQNRSLLYGDVYAFWDVFREKLNSENSYQRSIGLLLIAYNVKWDKDNQFDNAVNEYLSVLNDKKPITIRQCIQSLQKILPYKKELYFKIANKLMDIDILGIKTTMQKFILLDILDILLVIRKYQTVDKIESYIFNALSGEILDKKAKKRIESMLE
jgi:hypothetical protein